MAGAEDIGMWISQKMVQGAMSLGILGQIQLTPRWANDSVWLHNGSIQESCQGHVRAPPPPDRNQAEGGEGRSGKRRIEYLT